MAAGITDIVVRFLTDLSDLTGSVKSIDSKLSGLGKTARRVGTAIGGAFAVKQIGDFVNAAEEAQQANRRLEQTMKNAGDATGAWAKHAEDLADKLQRSTGIDDEVIKGGQAILSTFHSVGGALGQQSGAFDRATKAALDLSKTGFGDVDTAAKQLGKALEDPEKGLTALKRAGVNFTEDQKKVIKALVDSGDKAGAMNLILKEVENQVGGVAEKTATSGDKMRVAWNETKESLGRALLPVLQQLAPIVESLAGFVQDNATWLVPMTIGILGLVVALKAWIGAQAILNALLAAFGVEIAAPIGLVLAIGVAILAAYAAVAALYVKWDQVWSFIGGLPAYAKVAAAIFAITNPVTLLIGIVSALAVYWTNIWDRIVVVLAAAWQIIARIVEAIGDKFGWLAGIISSTVGFIVDKIDWLLDKLGALKSALKTGLTIGGGPLGGLFGGSSGADLIPHGVRGFAAGGIVTGPTLALIGEAGPEAVIPLGRTAAAGAGTVNITVHVTGLGADVPAVQRGVADALRQYTTRNGPIAGIAG